MRLLKENKVGLIVILVTLLSLGQLLYTTYQTNKTSQCQAQVNQAFLDTIKARAAVSDGDRESVKTLVEDITTAKTQAEADQAKQEYNFRYKTLDNYREGLAYPDIEGVCGND